MFSLALLIVLASCSVPKKEAESVPENSVSENNSSESVSESLPEPEAEPVLGKIQYFIDQPADDTELGEALDSLEDFVYNQAFLKMIDFDLDGDITDEQKLHLTYAAFYETDDEDYDELPEAVRNYPVKDEFGIDPESQAGVSYKSAKEVAESYYELFGEKEILHGVGDFVSHIVFYSPENGGWYFKSDLFNFPSCLYPEIISYEETADGFKFEFVNANYDEISKRNFDFLWFGSSDDFTYLNAENADELLLGQHYSAVLKRIGDDYVIRSLEKI